MEDKQRDAALRARIERLIEGQDAEVTNKVAFGHWLTTMMPQISDQNFNYFIRDAFDLVMRYVGQYQQQQGQQDGNFAQPDQAMDQNGGGDDQLQQQWAGDDQQQQQQDQDWNGNQQQQQQWNGNQQQQPQLQGSNQVADGINAPMDFSFVTPIPPAQPAQPVQLVQTVQPVNWNTCPPQAPGATQVSPQAGPQASASTPRTQASTLQGILSDALNTAWRFEGVDNLSPTKLVRGNDGPGPSSGGSGGTSRGGSGGPGPSSGGPGAGGANTGN